MKRHTLLLIFAVITMMFLWGCSSKTVPPTEPPASGSESGSSIGEESVGGQAGAGIEEEGLQGIKEPGTFGETISEGRTSGPMLPVYFDFDSYVIRDDMKARMDENAAFLMQHPNVRIEIQGNCDSRGTNEYNIALGEKRAMAAKKYLVILGVDPDRMDVVSFGEERPLDPSNTPEAWEKNRRDDFVITGQ